MKTVMKKTAAVLIAVMLLIGCAVTAVSAAGSAKARLLAWSGTTATWSAPTNGEINAYNVRLYKDGSLVATMTVFNMMYDFGSDMESSGDGSYTFEVYTYFTDSSYSVSDMSPSTYYVTKGHAHPLKHIGFKYPGCTTDGVKEHYECSTCGEWFWDSSGKNEIYDHNDVVLEKTGHSWSEWKVVKDPTTTSEGEEERYCYNDPNHVEQRAIKRLPDSEQGPYATQPVTSKSTPKATEPKSTDPKTTQPMATEPGATAPSGVSSTEPSSTVPGETVSWGFVIDPSDPSSGSTAQFSASPLLFVIIGVVAFLFLLTVAGVIICLIKNVLHLFITTTGGVGELSNFLLGASFVLVAGGVYHFKKIRTGALIGSVLGAVLMGLFSILSNYYLVYPIYYNFMPKEAILSAYQLIFSGVHNILECLIVFNAPFTCIKGLLSVVITFLIYKRLSPILKGNEE